MPSFCLANYGCQCAIEKRDRVTNRQRFGKPFPQGLQKGRGVRQGRPEAAATALAVRHGGYSSKGSSATRRVQRP
jgi:hypothetical protein